MIQLSFLKEYPGFHMETGWWEPELGASGKAGRPV